MDYFKFNCDFNDVDINPEEIVVSKYSEKVNKKIQVIIFVNRL